MTNINCSSNCMYQKDGKCHLDYAFHATIISNESCAYYSKKTEAKEESIVD